ncbi:MAG: hypothetical protein ABIC40_05945, partial [bacterium]
MHCRSLCAAAILVIIMIAGLIGCSGGGKSPVLPNLTGTDVEITKATNGQPAEVRAETSRNLWGLWTLNVNADHSAIEVVPVRDAQFHLNVTGYLENPPGVSNLKITNVSWTDWGTLLVDIQLKHPFKSSPTLTGFDVRGIAILPATKLFTSIITDVDGDPAQLYASRYLVNADGYSTLWNRETAKPVEYPKIFGYIRGKMATKNEMGIQGNLHGFRAFWTDPIRRIFQSNQAATRTYEFDFPPGPLSFAYAVDACWEPPDKTLTGDPGVLDVPGDFPLSANCPEPYQISTTIVSNTLTKVGGSATVQFEVFDWQDATAFSHVHVEAPDLFYGTLDPGSPINVGVNSSTYEIVIPNSNGDALTANGGSDLLVVVEDTTNSTSNPDLTAYNIFKLPVADVPAFWRDRHGDGSYVDVPLAVPLIVPSTLSTGMPDLAVVSYPVDPHALFNKEPEIMLFDDNDERFIAYDRDLNSTSEKAGYPLSPSSWLLFP